MTYNFHVISSLLSFFIIIDQLYYGVGFLLPSSSRRHHFSHHYLNHFSSSNLLSSRNENSNDDEGSPYNEGVEVYEIKSAPKVIQHVDFWGTKWTSNDDDNETTTKVPCVPTLDTRSGPLPPGAYIMEGKSEFDAKPTCRISIAVKRNLVSRDIMDDPDEVVRRLQACVDAGLDTFQLHDQETTSLDIIRRMNENTPSYVKTHWSVSMKAPSKFTNSNSLSPKLEIRQNILNLVEQTGSDGLDSLQVDCSSLKLSKHYGSTLDMFDYLTDLQREGWIRSIGIRGVGLPKLQQDIMTHFGDSIDFQQQDGNLLLPSLSTGSSTSKNFRMDNSLAGGLLTDTYSDKNWRSKNKRIGNSLRDPILLLTKDNKLLLKEWASQHQRRQKRSSSTSVPVWKLYQEQVVERLSWIALKHDVSMSAVALRWVLECSGDYKGDNTKEGSVISTSAVADVIFDSNEMFQNPVLEFRQVFRFQLDDEDKELLSLCTAYEIPSGEEDKYTEIDFDNRALWL